MSSQGVQIITRPITSTSDRQGYTSSMEEADNVIQEIPWTLDAMVQRPSFNSTFPWSTTNTSHTVLAKLRIPQDLLVTNITTAPFNSFKYWRGDVEIHAQVAATPLHQGLVLCFFVPLTTDAFSETNIVSNFAAATVNQSMYLYANTNTSSKMTIPFLSPLHYLDLEDSSPASTLGSLGYFYVVVFNPLQAAVSASTTVTISLFSRMINNSFKVPRLNGSTDFRAQSKLLSKLQSIPQRATNAFKDVGDSLKSAAKRILPENLVSDAIDSAFGIIGLDKPIDPNMQTPSRFVSTSTLNFANGVEFIDKMSVFPDKMALVTAETFATLNDEMSFDDLKRRFTYLGSFTQSVSQNPGTVLASLPINPIPSYVLQQANQVPLLSYISVPFNFWKGGLTYKVQVISTSFQTTKLFFGVNFGQYAALSTININTVTSQYGSAFEINQGSNEFEFTIPYVSKTHSLYVPNDNTPSDLDSLGTINIVVLNALVAPNNTPTTISFNVFIAGAPDYEVNTLSLMNNLMPAQNGPASEDFELVSKPFRAQSLSVAPLQTAQTDTYKTQEDNVVAPNDSVVQRVDLAETKVDSLRHYLRKYQYVRRVAFTVDFLASTSYAPSYTAIDILDVLAPHNPFTAPTVATIPIFQYPGLLSYYNPLYRSFKGALRFKFVLEQYPTTGSFSVYYAPKAKGVNMTGSAIADYLANAVDPDPTDPAPATTTTGLFIANNYMTRLTTVVCNSLQKTIECEIPYNSLYKHVLNRLPTGESYLGSAEFSSLGALYLVYDPIMTPLEALNGGEQQIFYMKVFTSFSDEARYGILYNVPLLVPNYANSTANPTPVSIFPDNYSPTINPNFTLTVV